MRRKMKKTVAGILAAAMVLAIGVAGVSAAGHGRGRNHAGRKFESVCDNYRFGHGKRACGGCSK